MPIITNITGAVEDAKTYIEQGTFMPYPRLYSGEKDNSIGDKFAAEEHPKFKFNFFVRFVFRDASGVNLDTNALGALDMKSNFLAVKQAGRLTPVIHYQDANYYGYRAKVATKTDFSVLSLTFYDDSANRAHSIVDAYLKAVMPITNIQDTGGLLSADPSDRQTIGVLQEGAEWGILKKIELLHTVGHRVGADTLYTYHNPKLANPQLDDLDMSDNGVNHISMSFVFEGFNIEHGTWDSSNGKLVGKSGGTTKNDSDSTA